MSVLEKAQQLTVRARTYSEGTKERDERTRIGNALGEVARVLGDLSTAADAYVAARAEGVPVNALPPTAELVNTSSEGLPSSQALTAARGRVTALTRSATDAVTLAWGDWAQAELAAVNPGRISRLGIQHRQLAVARQQRLHAAAIAKQVGADQITGFRRDLEALEQMLASIREDDPVVLLLDRIRRGRTSLAELSDEEIEVLRADSAVASQIVLRLT